MFVLGMELTEYGGMNIPPNMQDQGIYNDCHLATVYCFC